jgi:hypothetical protein
MTISGAEMSTARRRVHGLGHGPDVGAAERREHLHVASAIATWTPAAGCTRSICPAAARDGRPRRAATGERARRVVIAARRMPKA